MGQLNPILGNKSFGKQFCNDHVFSGGSLAHIWIPYCNIGRCSLPTAHHLAAHLLAEVTGTAGCEGQRADIGMAGVKRRPQQYFTPLIHTLCGVEAGAGLG